MAAPPRFFCTGPLLPGTTIGLSSGATRHVQVLRLQPGDIITLFGGDRGDMQAGCATIAGEFEATIAEIGRRAVQVVIGRHHPVDRELARELHLAIGMPANERMDWLVEKATELGVAVIQPLMTERSVVRLDEERARKKTAHWNSIAISACEQCGRNRVPEIRDIATLTSWRRQWGPTGANAASLRLILSLRQGAQPLQQIGRQLPQAGPITVLSGPEGGLSAAEEELAIQQGFAPVTLGPRILRAETAALAALTLLA
jgi:16S rRNA (uracil1498-N3)-methyltransferase